MQNLQGHQWRMADARSGMARLQDVLLDILVRLEAALRGPIQQVA